MSDNPTNTGPVERLSEEWWAARSPEIRARRCSAHRRNGDQCAKVAMEAQKVCGTHGGRAPQAKAKARQRLDEAADRMAHELLKIATTSESESIKLTAVRDALDRAGLKPPTQVEVGPNQPEPWEQLLGDVAHVTKAQHEAMKRGEPPPPSPLPPAPEPLEVVDAEIVEDGPERDAPVRRRPSWAEDADHAPQSARGQLVPLEQALEETAAANRATRIASTRRRR